MARWIFQDMAVAGPDNNSGSFRALRTAQLRETKPNREAFLAKPRLPIRVILDRVSGNYNTGAIFRLCDAFAIEKLIICGASVNLRKRKLVQAARGTEKWVPWSEAGSTEAAVLQAKAEGYQVVIAELTGNSVPPERLAARCPVCLILGGERSGISDEVAALADMATAIPMAGMGNSINVASAAAIILYHLAARITGER